MPSGIVMTEPTPQMPLLPLAFTNPTLSAILVGFDDAAVLIALYLSAEEKLSLHGMNRGLHSALSKHEEALFESFLERDFAEGEVLSHVAKARDLSRKRLYLAFYKRWSLPEQGDENTRVEVTWSRPERSPRQTNENVANGNIEDASSLVFIARIGNIDYDPDSCCALLGWNPDYDIKRQLGPDNSQLIINKRWSDQTGGLIL